MHRAKGWVSALAVAAIALCASAGDAPGPRTNPPQDPDAGPADPTEIQQLFTVLNSGDLEARHTAFTRLMAIGRPVLPFLEEHLRHRAGDEYVDLLYGLSVLPDKPKDAPVESANPAEVEKYLREKLAQVEKLHTAGDFEQADALGRAILAVEPRWSRRDDVLQVVSDCARRLTEKKTVRPSLTTQRGAYRTTDRIDLCFRLEDMTPAPVQLDFTGTLSGLSHAPKNPQDFIHADVTVTDYGPCGDMRSINRTMEWDLKENASVTPGSPWEFHAMLDPTTDGIDKSFRTYTVVAQVRPYLFHTPTGNLPGRTIEFPPLTINCSPLGGDPELLRRDAIAILPEALKMGDLNRVFIVTMLMPEKDRHGAIELLMDALPIADEPGQQCIMNCLFQLTRLPLGQSVDAWRDWWKQERANPRRRR